MGLMTGQKHIKEYSCGLRLRAFELGQKYTAHSAVSLYSLWKQTHKYLFQTLFMEILV